jgi:DNA-binding MarR family transcriptional regulator
MQVLVIAVQNAVAYRHLGTATSGVTFFRSIGGSFGTAIFGALFSNLLASHLSSLSSSLPPSFSISNAENAAAIQHLPASVRVEFVHVYAQSLSTVFLVAAPIAAIAFLLTWLLPEVRLRTTAMAPDMGQTFAMPTARSSREEIERALSVLVCRESRSLIYRRLADRAGVDLEPFCCWLLFRIQEGPISQENLAKRLGTSGEKLRPAIEAFTQKGLITGASLSEEQRSSQLLLTPAGQQTLDKLATAYHDSLAALLEGWSPEQEAELATLLRRVTPQFLHTDTRKEFVSAHSLCSTTSCP